MAAPRRPALTTSVTRGLDKLLPTISHQIDPDCANALKFLHGLVRFAQSAEYDAKRTVASERIRAAKAKRRVEVPADVTA